MIPELFVNVKEIRKKKEKEKEKKKKAFVWFSNLILSRMGKE